MDLIKDIFKKEITKNTSIMLDYIFHVFIERNA